MGGRIFQKSAPLTERCTRLTQKWLSHFSEWIPGHRIFQISGGGYFKILPPLLSVAQLFHQKDLADFELIWSDRIFQISAPPTERCTASRDNSLVKFRGTGYFKYPVWIPSDNPVCNLQKWFVLFSFFLYFLGDQDMLIMTSYEPTPQHTLE